MDGISRVAGQGPTVEFAGKTYQVQARALDHYAKIEAEIIKLRGDPFDALVKAAKELAESPQALASIASLVAEKFRGWRFVTYRDIFEFQGTPYGEAFLIWLGLGNPELTVQQVQFEIMEAIQSKGAEALQWKEGILAAIDQASGVDTLGNSTGPAPGATAKPE